MGGGNIGLSVIVNGQSVPLLEARNKFGNEQQYQQNQLVTFVGKNVTVDVPERGGSLKLLTVGLEYDGQITPLPDVPKLNDVIPKINSVPIGTYTSLIYDFLKSFFKIDNPNDGIGVIEREYQASPPLLFTWDNIPGTADEQRLLEFVKNEAVIRPLLRASSSTSFEGFFLNALTWKLDQTAITKVDNGNSILISNICFQVKQNPFDITRCFDASLKLDNSRKFAVMSGTYNGIKGTIHILPVKVEGNKLNVYEYDSFGIGPHDDVSIYNGRDSDSLGDFRLRYHIEEVGRPISNSGFLIQSTSGKQGNFELVVPRSDTGFNFYFRDNDNPTNNVWDGPFPSALDSGHIDSLSLIQSNFGNGNLEVIARSGNKLIEFWHPNGAAPTDWRRGQTLPFDNVPIDGNVALIQSTSGKQGNFELVVPRSDTGFNFYFRDNDNIRLVYYGPFPVATNSGHIDSLSLIQSNFGNGNLEVIARSGNKLIEFWHPNGAAPTDWIQSVELPN